MEYRKNDIVTLKIEDCGIDGEGIGKADGFTVFVKDAVIGDTDRAKNMKANKNYGYGPSIIGIRPSFQLVGQKMAGSSQVFMQDAPTALLRTVTVPLA